jgi:hypothetical protein
MEATHPALVKDPQDLLFRFAETPFASALETGGACILIRTNDPELLSVLPVRETSAGESPAFLWKIVRDDFCLWKAEDPSVVAAEDVTILSLGPACFAACDALRRELLCFVGARISPGEFRDSIVPRFRDLTQKALAAR